MKTRLSKILYDKGWTEMELSRRTGLAQSYINRVKNARIVPTVRTALKICSALEVAVEDAFIYEERPYGVTRAPYFPSSRATDGEPCLRYRSFGERGVPPQPDSSTPAHGAVVPPRKR
jgi:DNA-binding Xre family transcriptional regulator